MGFILQQPFTSPTAVLKAGETIAPFKAENTTDSSFFFIGRLMKTEYRHSKAGSFFPQLFRTLRKSICIFRGFGNQTKNSGQSSPLHSLPCWFAKLGGNRTQHKRDPHVQNMAFPEMGRKLHQEQYLLP